MSFSTGFPRRALPYASLAFGLWVTNATAFSSSPFDARTGAPLAGGGFELTCADGCHNSFPLDSGSGAVTIEAPGAYTPGETLTLMVKVEQIGQVRWGFEMTALDGDLDGVGTFVPIDANTQVGVSGTREYAQQTSIGTANGTLDTNMFTLEWDPPMADVGDVTFYAVGNAADGSGRTGDYIYSDSVSLPEPAFALGLASAVLPMVELRRAGERRNSMIPPDGWSC